MKRQAMCVGALAMMAVAAVATDAKADPVGNPGEFEFYINNNTDSYMWFSTSDAIYIAGDGTAGTPYVQLDLAGNGDVSYVFSDLPYSSNFSVSGIGNVRAKMQWTNVTGMVDADGQHMEFTATARVRFEPGSGASFTACNTSTFQISLIVDDGGAGTCPSGGYNYTTGAYCMFTMSTFTIPQLSASACSNNGNALNSRFGLGLGGADMQIRGGTTSPVISN